MRSTIMLAAALLLTGPARAGLVVVELFQSQGCSSCPPANANLNAVAGRADLLPLSFAVTYWDRLGWPDRFASPAYTARQYDYAHAQGRQSVWTPQVYVNGRTTLVGPRPAEFAGAITAATPLPALPVSATAGQISLSAQGGGGDLWLVRYDPRQRDVAVRAGENAGRTLPHRNIVVQLVKLGRWNGAAARYALPAAPDAGLASALLLQAGQGGPIVAASRL